MGPGPEARLAPRCLPSSHTGPATKTCGLVAAQPVVRVTTVAEGAGVAINQTEVQISALPGHHNKGLHLSEPHFPQLAKWKEQNLRLTERRGELDEKHLARRLAHDRGERRLFLKGHRSAQHTSARSPCRHAASPEASP